MAGDRVRVEQWGHHRRHGSPPSDASDLLLPDPRLFLPPYPPPKSPRLEKLQTEHGLSMSKYAKLEEDNALLESALASLRAGNILCSSERLYEKYGVRCLAQFHSPFFTYSFIYPMLSFIILHLCTPPKISASHTIINS